MALQNKEQNEKQKEVEESNKETVTISSKVDGINVLEENAIHTKNNPTNETQVKSTEVPNSKQEVVGEVKTPKETILVDAKKRTTVYPMSGGVHRFILQHDMVSWKVNRFDSLKMLRL